MKSVTEGTDSAISRGNLRRKRMNQPDVTLTDTESSDLVALFLSAGVATGLSLYLTHWAVEAFLSLW